MAAGSFVWRCKTATVAVVFPAFAIMLGMPAQARAGCAPPPIAFSPSTAQSKPQQWAAMPEVSAGSAAQNGPGQKLVGLWEDVYTDTNGNPQNFYQFELYHDDQTELEVDQSPILTGNVCLGTWKKLQGNTYGLMHPFFFFQGSDQGPENTEGQWGGYSGYYTCTITVAIDGNSFQSKCHSKAVAGPDPLNPRATVVGESDFGIQGKRIGVDESLLP